MPRLVATLTCSLLGSRERTPRSRLLLPLIAAIAACVPLALTAQPSFQTRPITNEAWLRWIPPFRIVGDLYYVGGEDLGSYLLTTSEGHILINTGAYGSVAMIRTSIETLGFDFDDIEILLTTQAHWDHVADLAEIKRLTGARMLAHEGDVASLQDGGVSDFRFPDGRDPVFEPVMVDRVLQDGDTIQLGGRTVTLLHHPGHTKGSSSFSFTTGDDERSYSVLVVNMGTINPGVSLLDMPAYPQIAAEYGSTFAAQKALSPDVWVSSHAGHFDLHDRVPPGDAYDPQRFSAGYREKIALYEERYLNQLQEERAGGSR